MSPSIIEVKVTVMHLAMAEHYWDEMLFGSSLVSQSDKPINPMLKTATIATTIAIIITYFISTILIVMIKIIKN